MGVRNLWALVEPSGRRIDFDDLRGTSVAVDASIWAVAFIKAARDERGDVDPAACARGFFRRCLRLLHHGVDAVFVFDGATPGLKRRTTAKRRRMRETNAAKVRKTAEKVLLNELKRRALRHEKRRIEKKGDVDISESANSAEGGDEFVRGGDVGDAAGASDDGWERDWNSDDDLDGEEEEEEEEEFEEELDMFVPDGESIDPEVLGALPPSVRLDVIMKMREKRTAENRESFARASGQMADFSSLQLETYLKGTKLKRQIDAVMQRSDPDDPMMSKRVAAQSGREFIFAGPSFKRGTANAKNALALPTTSSSGMDALKTGLFENANISGASRRGRAPVALTAPQEQFLLTSLHPTLPAPSVAKSIAETPVAFDAPATLNLQISFTTENLKSAARDPLFKDAGEFEDADVEEDEWEDVDEAVPKASLPLLALAAAPPPPNLQEIDDDSGDVIVDADDVGDVEGVQEETALSRKNVYSISHGFLKGRSLDGWDAEEEVLAPSILAPVDEGDVDAAIQMGLEAKRSPHARVDEDDEDEDMQKAIVLSMLDEHEVEVKTEEEKELEAAVAMSLDEIVVKAPERIIDGVSEVEDIREVKGVKGESVGTVRDEEPKSEIAPTLEFEEATAEEEEWIAAAKEAERIKNHERIEKLIEEAEAEHAQLRQESRRAKQGADEVTDDMYREVQELLTLFGIPYIIAPQEAEAQCAYLNEHNFVDAVITDDSDVFLFGAKRVYRNFFSGSKYCEMYSADRIEKELGLDRDRFIQLALLLGSDYTEGIHGIGIVNAIEIVSTFQGPVAEASKAFKSWVELEELTMVPEKLLPIVPHVESPAEKAHADPEENPLAAVFKAKHRSLKKTWDIPATFPSLEVIKAYQQPAVDRSEEKFEWGKPDVDMLRLFCVKTFQWTRDAADKVLLPVLKSWSKKEAQRRIDSFFESTATISSRVAKFRSARVGKAVANLTTNGVLNPDLVLLRDPANGLLDDDDVIVDYGDGQIGRVDREGRDQLALVPTLDDEDDAFLEVDLSQFSNPSAAASPEPKRARKEPSARTKPKPKPVDRTRNASS